jgi:hypothetical protein
MIEIAKRLQRISKGKEEKKSFQHLQAAMLKVEGQRVLGEAFCINRLDSIRQLVGNAKLKDFTNGADRDIRETKITHFFRRFLRQNAEGDSPYFCFSCYPWEVDSHL